MATNYVFLTEVADFTEAQVVKSLLEGMHLNPRFRDQQMRSIAPHLGNALGAFTIEIPEDEFLKASQALEHLQNESRSQIEEEKNNPSHEDMLVLTQELAKKSLLSSVLGCIFLPIVGSLYSMILGARVLNAERPLTPISRRRLMWAIFFNIIALYAWLVIGPRYFTHH